MSSTTFPSTALPSRTVPGTLADRLPRSIPMTATMIVAGAITIGIASQLSIPLGFTPVPLSLSTFAVLLTGMTLGPGRGLAAVGLFAVAGVAGVPWFANHQHGYAFASFGYILGYLLAAALAGWMARRRGDRTVLKTFGVAAISSACIYLPGVAWLIGSAHLGLAAALAQGVLPFLVGDAIKAAVAAGVLPTTWRLVDRAR